MEFFDAVNGNVKPTPVAFKVQIHSFQQTVGTELETGKIWHFDVLVVSCYIVQLSLRGLFEFGAATRYRGRTISRHRLNETSKPLQKK